MKNLCVLIVILCLTLAGCASIPPNAAQSLVSASRDTAVVVAATASTQPGGQATAKAASDVVTAIDTKVAPIAAKVDGIGNAVGTIADKQASLEAKVAAITQAAANGAGIVHDVAPNSKADNTAQLVTALLGTLATLGVAWIGHKNTQAAIVTPGTTPAPDAKG